MTTTARVFQSGNSQAIRLPKEFRFSTTEVEICRRGNEVILRERPQRLSELLAGLPAWPDDVVEPEDALPQVRIEL